ncbi:MAG: hypothetical protein ACRDYZ_10780 [Acidimicrobiales bacterium]
MTEDRRLLVKEADVVAFDLFDTLFVRSVARPRDAFRLAQELLNDRSDWYLTDELAPLRLEAELSLREEAVAAGRSADGVTMDAIYSRVGQMGALPQELTAALMAAELDAERLLLQPTETIVLLRFAIDQGKDVVAVSDTYLPRGFVAELLAGAGVHGGHELWLSSEHQASKADGSLWASLVASRRGRDILHFGDNEVSDLIQARAFGIKVVPEVNRPDALRRGVGSAGALHGQWTFDHLVADGCRLKNVHRSLVAGLAANRLGAAAEESSAGAVGYGAFGPLLLGYVQWLHRAARAAGHDRLFFLARDGRVMQEAYTAHWGSEALPSTYLLASRRVFNLAAIGQTLNNRDVDFLTQTSWRMPVGEYFSRLALPAVEAEARRLLERLGLSPDDPGEVHGAELRAVFWQLEDHLVAAAASERERLLEYWEVAGLLATARPGLVDIGWHGSLQRGAQRVLAHAGIERPLGGLYFGLHAERPIGSCEPMQAFVDGAAPGDGILYRDLVAGSVAPLEFCFTGPEGTVIGLDGAGGDFSGEPKGRRFVGRHADDRLGAADAVVLDQLQRAAIDFVRDFRQATADMPTTVSSIERDVAAENMVMLLSVPTAMAADVLGRRRHSDGFGVGVAWKLIGAPSREAAWYEEEPHQLADELADADWRAGFVANAQAMGLSAN